MSLSKIIQDNTDHGYTIVTFLIHAMEGRLPGFEARHRLTAARLLIAYGRDEDDHPAGFVSERAQRDLFSRPATRRALKATGVNPILTKLIMSQTDDGRRLIDFLIDVMEGRIDRVHPKHRMAAATELLARGFGKCSSKRLPPAPPIPTAPQLPPYDGQATEELLSRITPFIEAYEEEQRLASHEAEPQQPVPIDEHDSGAGHADPELATDPIESDTQGDEQAPSGLPTLNKQNEPDLPRRGAPIRPSLDPKTFHY